MFSFVIYSDTSFPHALGLNFGESLCNVYIRSRLSLLTFISFIFFRLFFPRSSCLHLQGGSSSLIFNRPYFNHFLFMFLFIFFHFSSFLPFPMIKLFFLFFYVFFIHSFIRTFRFIESVYISYLFL